MTMWRAAIQNTYMNFVAKWNSTLNITSFLCPSFCFVSFIVNFTFFALESSGKLATKCTAIFLVALSGSKLKLVFKPLILGAFLDRYHRQILSLWNESVISMAYPKPYGFERILHTTQLINGEKYGYNLNFLFFNTLFYSMHIVFNSYIFVTGRNDSDQKVSDGINNFAVHYPQVSRQKKWEPCLFFMKYFNSNPICPKTVSKIKYKNFFLFSITYE